MSYAAALGIHRLLKALRIPLVMRLWLLDWEWRRRFRGWSDDQIDTFVGMLRDTRGRA